MTHKQFVSFKIDDLLFGIEILLVKEINRKLEFTPVFDVAYFVVGTANLRGQVITILDIGQRLGLPPRELADRSRVIVLKTESELRSQHRSGQLDDHAVDDKVGFLVDRIGDVIQVDVENVHQVPANLEPTQARYADGVVPLDDRLMIILKVEKLLAKDAQVATA